MLVLSSLNKLLSQVLAPPAIHTAVLFTTTGELLSCASSNQNHSKDDVRILVGLGTEVWSETKEEGEGMVDSEVCFAAFVKPQCTLITDGSLDVLLSILSPSQRGLNKHPVHSF